MLEMRCCFLCSNTLRCSLLVLLQLVNVDADLLTAGVRVCVPPAGEEEVPPGVVGVIVLGDCPDVLSHCAVRARNCKIPVVACPRCVC